VSAREAIAAEAAAKAGARSGRGTRPGPTWGWPGMLVVASAGAFLLLVGLPLAALLARTLPAGLLGRYLADPQVVSALRLSLVTTTCTLALALAIGTPVAYALARREFRGKQLLDTLIDLPMVLPPAVAGVALLMAFGRRGLLGGWLTAFGIELAFTTGAVVIAQTFVAAPFYVRAARAGFASVDPVLEGVSHTLGVSSLRTFWRVTVPLAMPALLGGAVMTWARALGEFGATIMFAGNFVGRTQTMPLAVYQSMESDLNVSLTLSTILVVASFAVLFLFRVLVRRGVAAG
jgi:molybdate transport system permease protein